MASIIYVLLTCCSNYIIYIWYFDFITFILAADLFTMFFCLSFCVRKSFVHHCCNVVSIFHVSRIMFFWCAFSVSQLENTVAQQQVEVKALKEKLVSHDSAAKRAVTTLQSELKSRVDQVFQSFLAVFHLAEIMYYGLFFSVCEFLLFRASCKNH